MRWTKLHFLKIISKQTWYKPIAINGQWFVITPHSYLSLYSSFFLLNFVSTSYVTQQDNFYPCQNKWCPIQKHRAGYRIIVINFGKCDSQIWTDDQLNGWFFISFHELLKVRIPKIPFVITFSTYPFFIDLNCNQRWLCTGSGENLLNGDSQ